MAPATATSPKGPPRAPRPRAAVVVDAAAALPRAVPDEPAVNAGRGALRSMIIRVMSMLDWTDWADWALNPPLARGGLPAGVCMSPPENR